MFLDVKKAHQSTPLPSVGRRKEWLFRIFDLGAASLGLLFFSIPMVFIAILIKIEDPRSPIIFKQSRVGKAGKRFTMYKFRSMYTGAEARLQDLAAQNEVTGPMFKMKNDPRITKIGKIIRKLSIDEFPQFINVLKGEMSLVGPRPPLEHEYNQYSEYEKKRLLVKPGCTGLWQVSGRNRLSFAEMVKLDLQYIEKRSFFLNLKIIFLTFKEITVFGKGM